MFAELPTVQCPKCAHRWEPEHASEVEEGDRVRCPECRTQLKCDEVEEIRSAYWSVVDDDEDGETPEQSGGGADK